jgi:hypothetical protein
MQDSERVVPAIERLLAESALTPTGNPRFETMQMIAEPSAELRLL